MQEALFSGLITTLVQSRPLSFFEIYMVYFTVQNRSTLSALKRKRVDIDFERIYTFGVLLSAKVTLVTFRNLLVQFMFYCLDGKTLFNTR